MQEFEDPATGVYHDGDEVAVRLNSKTSRAYHEPATDAVGNVVFDDDGHPKPACGKDSPEGKAWILRPVRSPSRRGKCDNCKDDDDAISERNSKGSDNVTLARLAQRSDWEGAESLSANDTHIHSD